MGTPSRSMIAIFLSLLFLVGCASPDNPIPDPTRPAETKSIPVVGTNTPASLPTTSPAPTASPTETQLDLSDLSGYPLLAPENLAQIVYLGDLSLAQDSAEMRIQTYDWSDDGGRIVACAESNGSRSYQVFDLSGPTRLVEIQLPFEGFPLSLIYDEWLQFSREGGLFLGLKEMEEGSLDFRPAVFDSLTGEVLARLPDHPIDVRYTPVATFSSQGSRIALTSIIINPPPPEDPDAEFQAGFATVAGVILELYDAQSGEWWGTFWKFPDNYISDLEYSTAGDYLVGGTKEKVFAWHVEGKNTLEVDCPYAGITFSPVVETAALTCFPREEKPFSLIWDLTVDEVIRLEDAPGDYYQQFRFSPKGKLLIGLAGYGEVSIWDGELGNLLITLPETYDEAVDAHFIGDGRLVAVLFRDGGLKLYGVK